MHSAPSVSYPVGRSLFAAGFTLSLWAAAAAAICAWWFQDQPSAWRLAAALALLAATGVWAAAAWWRTPAGELAWDGAGWSCSPGHAAGPGSLQVSLDLQRWLLVRWLAASGSQWLWLEHGRCPGRWSDLRRAVYSRVQPRGTPGAQARHGNP